MNLLPEKSELVPIVDDTNVFAQTPFIKEWNQLDFKDKLQIVCDLVRQTMIYEESPDPSVELEQLKGDSYTASKITIEYLKELSLGKNHRLAFAYKKPYENEGCVTTHVVALVDNSNNQTYFVDSTPRIGYKYGKVEQTVTPFYEDFIEMDNELQFVYEVLRFIKYNLKINSPNIIGYKDWIEYAKKYEVLSGTLIEINGKLKSLGLDYDKSIILPDTINNEKMIKELKKWREELLDLLESDKDIKKQLELSQTINSITCKGEPLIEIKGKKYLLSQLTPRFFSDNNLCIVMIKPSAYIFGMEDYVRDRMTRGHNCYGSYDPRFDLNSKYGLTKMKLFHPHGYKYIREMQGPSEMIMVEIDTLESCKEKRKIRQELKPLALDKEVIWFDNKIIDWNPMCLNFIHTSDNYSESSMNYSIGYPEYQLMSRFMYPNLKLERK